MKPVDQVVLGKLVDQAAFTSIWPISTQPGFIYLGLKDPIPITH